MRIHVYTFDTEAAAQAFADGIELANDSALLVDSILPAEETSGYAVTLVDYDEEEEEDQGCQKKHCECE